MPTGKSPNATQNDRHERRATSIIDWSQVTVDKMKRLSIVVAALLFIAAGCGQSGPLYIADNPSQIYQEAPAPESNSQSTSEDEQEEDSEADKE